MCHHCVVESVKSRMLSRRDLFRGGAVLAGAAAIAGTAAPRPLFAQGSPMRAVDLTHEFVSMITYQRAFSANAKTITTADEMLIEMSQLKR